MTRKTRRTNYIILRLRRCKEDVFSCQGGLSIQVKTPAAAPEANPEGNIIESGVFMFKGGADLKEIVDGFNKIGASSKDLIEMLKAVKAAGALHAELIIQ